MSEHETNRVSADDLADEFGSVQVRQTDDGTVWVRVEDIYKPSEDSSTIVVEAMTPHGDTFEERFEEPKTWDMSYEFVRFVSRNDYDASSFQYLLGDEVEAEYDDNEWRFKTSQFDPEQVSLWELGLGLGAGLGIIIAILIGLGLLANELFAMLPF